MRGEVLLRALGGDTMTATTPAEAQTSLDQFWSSTGDAALRPPGRYVDPDELEGGERPRWPSVGEPSAEAEVLMALPLMPYPATIEESSALQTTEPPLPSGQPLPRSTRGLGGIELTLRHRLGTGSLEIYSTSGHRARLTRPGGRRLGFYRAHR